MVILQPNDERTSGMIGGEIDLRGWDLRLNFVVGSYFLHIKNLQHREVL